MRIARLPKIRFRLSFNPYSLARHQAKQQSKQQARRPAKQQQQQQQQQQARHQAKHQAKHHLSKYQLPATRTKSLFPPISQSSSAVLPSSSSRSGCGAGTGRRSRRDSVETIIVWGIMVDMVVEEVGILVEAEVGILVEVEMEVEVEEEMVVVEAGMDVGSIA
ncbi:MAG: hypothetical protein MMC33_007182 [Icmadophila ericetorum]|nr:hypothetical protein [Icmadophila ericetorum]